jgi:hypothetical protein
MFSNSVIRLPSSSKTWEDQQLSTLPGLIPEGSRCYLIMMQLAGTYVSILFDRNKAKFPMMAIPLRMDEEVYCSDQF